MGTRTGGMTAFGITNIVLGAIFAVLGLLAAAAGGLLAVGGSAFEAELGPEAQGLGDMAVAGGALLVVTGLVTALAWTLLFVGGIGILRLANWSRVFSIVAASILICLNVFSLFQGGFNVIAFAVIGYCGVLIGYCCSTDWKLAFSDSEYEHIPDGAIVYDGSSASDGPGRAAA